jgi:hypothetical protein
MKATLLLLAMLMTASLGLSGCMGQDCSTEQDSEGQRVVCQGTSFSYTLQGTRSLETDQYTWENKKDQARVEVVFQGPGDAQVTIQDAAGAQVYSKKHSGVGQTTGSQLTSDGSPGTWTIKIEVTGLNGQVVLRVTPA